MSDEGISKNIERNFSNFDVQRVLKIYEIFSSRINKKPYEFTVHFKDGSSKKVQRLTFDKTLVDASEIGLTVEYIELYFVKVAANQETKILHLRAWYNEKVVSLKLGISVSNGSKPAIDWAKSMYSDLSRIVDSWQPDKTLLPPSRAASKLPISRNEPKAFSVNNSQNRQEDWKWWVGTALTIVAIFIAWLTYLHMK